MTVTKLMSAKLVFPKSIIKQFIERLLDYINQLSFITFCKSYIFRLRLIDFPSILKLITSFMKLICRTLCHFLNFLIEIPLEYLTNLLNKNPFNGLPSPAFSLLAIYNESHCAW